MATDAMDDDGRVCPAHLTGFGRFEVGRIKTFHAEKGFGFIVCEALNLQGYQGDVFLHHRHKGSFEPGDEVAFMAILRNGKLQGKDLQAAAAVLGDGLGGIMGGMMTGIIGGMESEPKRARMMPCRIYTLGRVSVQWLACALMKNDGFAKRNASSTKFSRKIGWLNSHGKLLEEIRFSEVKEWLSKIGEDEAMIILQSLEKKAGEIQHPTNYVISAARNSLGGGRQRRGKGGGKRKGSALDQSKSPPEPEEAPSRPAPAEPVEPVDIEEEEEEHEDSMGVHLQAGEEPSPEEEAADTPMEHEEADEEDSAQGETMDAAKVEDSLRYLNAHANLNQELEVERLLDPLIELGPVKAMGILQNLEQKSSEVRDPTGYVLAAIRKGSNGSGQAQKSGGRKVMKLHLKENRSSSSSFDPAQVEKVKKRINWLNDRGGLNDKLTYEIVGDLLLRSGPIGEIMKILKTLEENAAEVRNPNNYIAKAARRLAEEGVAPEPQSSANRRAAAQGGGDFRDEPGDFRAEPLEKQLHAHISWLNREVQLNATLDFGQVAPYLLQLPPEHAGDILSRLEKSAAEVRDPNSYVVKAAQRNLEGRDSGGKGAGRRQPPPPPRAMQAPEPPPSRNSAAPSDKIAKRVAWLNQHTQLAAPLDYDRLAPALQSIGYYQSLDVLNTLEEHASTVRDPNAYVLAGIRKVAGEGRGQPAMQALPAPPMPHPMPPPPPQGKGHARGEEKVVRRLEWLNKNVCPGKPIDINRATHLAAGLRPPPILNFGDP
eukprot:s1019_g2.t2